MTTIYNQLSPYNTEVSLVENDYLGKMDIKEISL